MIGSFAFRTDVHCRLASSNLKPHSVAQSGSDGKISQNSSLSWAHTSHPFTTGTASATSGERDRRYVYFIFFEKMVLLS